MRTTLSERVPPRAWRDQIEMSRSLGPTWLSKRYGKDSPVSATYYQDSDYQATIDYAEALQSASRML